MYTTWEEKVSRAGVVRRTVRRHTRNVAGQYNDFASLNKETYRRVSPKHSPTLISLVPIQEEEEVDDFDPSHIVHRLPDEPWFRTMLITFAGDDKWDGGDTGTWNAASGDARAAEFNGDSTGGDNYGADNAADGGGGNVNGGAGNNCGQGNSTSSLVLTLLISPQKVTFLVNAPNPRRWFASIV